MNRVKAAGKLFIGACVTMVLGSAGAVEPIGNLSRIEGVAIVSSGAQYVKAHEGLALKEGDRLMTLEGGSALITFTDGCEYRLSDDELFTVGPVSSCASTAVGSYKVDPNSAVSRDPGVAAASFQNAALGDAAVFSEGLSWVVPAAVGIVAVLGASLDTGGNTGGTSISP